MHRLKHLIMCITFKRFIGLNSHVVYPNGISCTLPEDIQEDLIQTIPGLEQAKLLFPGLLVLFISPH